MCRLDGIDPCEEETAGLWADLAHRQCRLVHRAETLHDLARAKGPEVGLDGKAPWLTATGFPERGALIRLFTSPRWRKMAMSDDLYVSLSSVAPGATRTPISAGRCRRGAQQGR